MGVDDTARFRRHPLRGLVTARLLIGLMVLALAFYGAWLIYRPAGYLTAAALLLLDLATSDRRDTP